MPRVPLLLLLLLRIASAMGSATAETKPMAYEALATFDFPPGILPIEGFSSAMTVEEGN
ncbi:hypothetical protein OsI_19645 [Oryza sativa Indica Group]|jgi:hypothetical protein|uniref:Uncharacterized protein n=1 Tax=Oryza sativa subsp. indica TaxID=39946 RepID=B8AXE2_ORYSI|nr:hypothetical protein OsI_19645 [Oryza sativa Indica Group]